MNQIPIDPAVPSAYESNHEAKPMMTLQTLPPAVSFPPALFPAIWPGSGVKNEVKKPTQFKQGIVTVTARQTPQRGASYYELRYVDPDTGKEVRRRVSGLEPDEVKDMAQNLTRRAYTHRGYLAEKAPGIEEGILAAVKLSRSRDYTKADMVNRAKPFLTYLAENYPAVHTWGDLRPGMVEGYLRHCERLKLAHASIRLRLAPIRLAWRLMHADYPERVKTPARLKLPAPERREIECLDAGELAVLLDWLKAHAPDIWPMACLQGLAGLRMLEAAALRVQDVDLKAGTVRITKTEHHEPKTKTSYRMLSVCGEVIEALKGAIAGQKVRPATGELFTSSTGSLWTKNTLAQKWARALRHAAAEPKEIKRERTGKRLTLNPHGLNRPRLKQIPPHKLRAAFATMAGRLGAQDRLLKAYLGHSSGDILGGHYRRIDLDELRTVSDLMNGWREASKAADARKETGNIPAFVNSNC